MILSLLTVSSCCFQSLTPEQSDLIEIAHRAIQAQVLHSPLELQTRRVAKAVFVTIERDGTIRGCRGDLLPHALSLEAEVAKAAQDAAAHDPRYRPVTEGELKQILVTITIVERQSRLDDISTLLPSEGLVLTCNHRTGVVLPWEGKDPATRLKWAYRKAGVPENSPAILDRLIAERFRG